MIGEAGDEEKWRGVLGYYGRLAMMSSPAGEYFVDWKNLGGSEDWRGGWRIMVDGGEGWGLWCPTFMLPRQLNGYFIWVGLGRRGEDLVVQTCYHRSTSSIVASMLLKCYVCLTVPLSGGNTNMTLKQHGQGQIKHNNTDLLVFPSPPWNKFHPGAPPSIMLRVLPT